MFKKLKDLILKNKLFVFKKDLDLDHLDSQDLSRFSEQDIILETESDLQTYLPDVLGQALEGHGSTNGFWMLFLNIPLKY